MTTKRDEYTALRARNPIAAARFLEAHAREIYPEQAATEAQPEPASVTDIEAAKAYRAARADNPVAGATLMQQQPRSIVRGLEALRGARPMPPDDPPPQAA